MKLSTWLRAAALAQIAMIGLATLGTVVSIVLLPMPLSGMSAVLGVMLLNVVALTAIWVPVLRSADGIERAEQGAFDAEQVGSALWSLGSHFKRLVLLALFAPVLMAAILAFHAITSALGHDVLWLI